MLRTYNLQLNAHSCIQTACVKLKTTTLQNFNNLQTPFRQQLCHNCNILIIYHIYFFKLAQIIDEKKIVKDVTITGKIFYFNYC